jgi:hypothetical protein
MARWRGALVAPARLIGDKIVAVQLGFGGFLIGDHFEVAWIGRLALKDAGLCAVGKDEPDIAASVHV